MPGHAPCEGMPPCGGVSSSSGHREPIVRAPLVLASTNAVPAESRRRGVLIEFARYFAASGAALGVDVGLYQLSMHLGWSYAAAAVIGFSAGAAIAYAASVLWVFGERSMRNMALEFGLFILVGVGGLLLTEALLWIEISRMGLPALWSKIGASGFVFVFNFAIRKLMLFSDYRR